MSKAKRVKVLPVEPSELMFAFNIADAAASLRIPVENPEQKSFNLRNANDILKITLKDKPLNRAGLAVSEHFKGDKFRDIMLRLFAFHDV